MSRFVKMKPLQTFWRSKSDIPEKIKDSRLNKIADYFKNIITDYKVVAIEMVEDMKARPIKSGIYISIITTIGVLFKTNPGESEFHSRLTESVTDLMLVSERIRNPQSASTVNELAKYTVDGRLRCYNIGVCSLMCLKSHAAEVKLYSANCKYTQPHWSEFYKTVVDVGVFGRWVKLEEAMVDFDVNPKEWKDDGQPNKDFKYYGNNSISWDMKMK